MTRLHHVLTVLITATLLLGCTAVQADGHKKGEAIKVAILTGQNNHAWMIDTPVLKNIIDEAKLFEATILQTPDRKSKNKAEEWKAFTPDFTQYDVIVLNYNGEMWPDHVKKAWLDYVSGGGKVYSFHAGNNPFRGWAEFEQMIGLLWRNNKSGKRLYFDNQGNKQVMETGQGPGAGHGRQHAYQVDTLTPKNPIFRDLPDKWMHAKDELYHGQRGPAENVTVMLSAFSSKESGGTGVSEPILWTIPYGKGTVMTNVMGHWWKGQKEGPALACAGFQTILTRSLEWLATGKVTIPKPDDFPTADAVSLRKLAAYEPLAYVHVHGMPGSDPLASCEHCSPQTQPGVVSFWAQYAAMGQPLPQEATASER